VSRRCTERCGVAGTAPLLFTEWVWLSHTGQRDLRQEHELALARLVWPCAGELSSLRIAVRRRTAKMTQLLLETRHGPRLLRGPCSFLGVESERGRGAWKVLRGVAIDGRFEPGPDDRYDVLGILLRASRARRLERGCATGEGP